MRRPRCPSCGNDLSFIVETKEDTGEVIIIVCCEWCDEYEGFVLNTHMTQKDFDMYKDKVLKRPRLWLVEIAQG